ncbi:hypothetical protein [Kineosporia sp. R_H_3]|uniref:hypothetical protein n=1 Tax=Kineosporia sp. R_H_3 TaxID=1961848 RepID=UPI00117A64E0|nr:hypothetical protein [Kineosporia sp. R_H_3]
MTHDPDRPPDVRVPLPAALAQPSWRRWVPALVTAVAIGMHLVMAVPYAASGLLAPGWAVALLAVWWFVLGGVLLVLAARPVRARGAARRAAHVGGGRLRR